MTKKCNISNKFVLVKVIKKKADIEILKTVGYICNIGIFGSQKQRKTKKARYSAHREKCSLLTRCSPCTHIAFCAPCLQPWRQRPSDDPPPCLFRCFLKMVEQSALAFPFPTSLFSTFWLSTDLSLLPCIFRYNKNVIR